MNKLKYWLNRFRLKFNEDYKNCDGGCEVCNAYKVCKEVDKYAMNKK